MVQCEVCGEVLRMEFDCGRCGGTYCSEHRLPEAHDCPPVVGNGSERWFSEKFEDTDETRRRGNLSEGGSGEDRSVPKTTREESDTDTDTNPSGRSMPSHNPGASPPTEKSPSSKPAPTSSSPEVNPDGSIDRSKPGSPRPNPEPSSNKDSPSRRTWVIALVVLLIPLAAGAGVVVMDPTTFGSGQDAGSAVGATAETTGPTATPTPDATADAAAADSSLNVTAIRNAVHERVNQVRAERGLEALEYHDRTAESAQEHAEWMAEAGNFEHSDTNQYLCRAGENIAYTYAYSDVKTDDGGIVNHHGNETAIGYGLVRGWMHSEPHRENLLDDDNKFEGIGIGIKETSEGTRVYAAQALCKS